MHPTLNAVKYLGQLYLGAKTQYKTQCGGMPSFVLKEMKKMNQDLMWSGKGSQISRPQMTAAKSLGGKGMLDIESRNEAIALNLGKRYLNLGPDRPKWTILADSIIAKHCLKNPEVDDAVKFNTFLQNWNTNVRDIPILLQTMVKAIEDYGFRFKDIRPTMHIMNEMWLWHHPAETRQMTQKNAKTIARCLRSNHAVLKV
ncbi:hypothetical protein C8J56DRAFT_781069, partial [Mycena floridula]